MVKVAIGFVGGVLAIAVIAALGLAPVPWNTGALVGAAAGAAVVALIAGHRRTMCPRCQTLMATFRWPGSVKQALWGGWTCPSCGCQMDRSGRELARQGAEHA